MSNRIYIDVPTGDPAPRCRYRIGYRCRLHNKPDDLWIMGEMELISRSPEGAKEFAAQIMDDGNFEYEFSSCTDVTDGEV